MSKKKLPPSLKGGLWGDHFFKYHRSPTDFLTRLSKLGDITFIRLQNRPVYFLNHPDLVKDLLITNITKFEKSRALKGSKGLLGEGLLTSEGERHLRQRRLIQPAFHRQRIADYAKVMIECAEKLRDQWKEGEVRDIDKDMVRLTLQIVVKTLFNANVDDQADEVGRSIASLVERENVVFPFSEWFKKLHLPLPHLNRLKESERKLNEVIYRIIEDRRKSYKDEGDLLSMLLMTQDEQDGTGMSDRQIHDETLTLFVAGHETTANAMIFTWYLLSQNPEKAAKLQEELDQVLSGRTPSMEDIPKLKYTEAVFAESIRLFPPAWAIGRNSLEEHQFGEYKIPKNALVLVSQYVLHRDERFWENPDEFIPERWFEQSIKEAGNKYIYFPFGKGVRSCVGESFSWMEGILSIAILANKRRLSLLPEQKIGLKAVGTLRPKYGMKMQIEG